ncbi:MAG: hypothetical protein M1834_007101 [Cirrosporium novae-zelandiae]|nr:MAG: hypothetical protein M1834_007101 [Cirrosporium novae-zelandiae]
MSFFGFDSTLPKDRGRPSENRGFFEHADPFAEMSRARAQEQNNDNAIDFEDTYDGLADQLEETGDDFNEDTFGGGADTDKPAPDFDFYGQTAKVSNAISEEQMRYSRHQLPPKSVASVVVSPHKQSTNPMRTGYERYKDPGYIPELQANESLWGASSRKPTQFPEYQQSHDAFGSPGPHQGTLPAKKMMSLEEVEALMRAQAKHTSPPQLQQSAYPPPQASPAQVMQKMPPRRMSQQTIPPHMLPRDYPQTFGPVPGQRPPEMMQGRPTPERAPQGPQGPQFSQAQQQFPLQQATENVAQQAYHVLQASSQGPTTTQGRNDAPQRYNPAAATSGYGAQHPRIITHPQQLMQLSEAERKTYLEEDAKRAKRNHKIFLLSKDNGLMTPQDKNFITRIQLQQLMTVTGNVNEQDPDAALNEDFYYYVHSQIRGIPRQHPNQPLGHFAQTYLFQTSGRHGPSGRRHMHGENHMQRMQQQVQRAVEAAKLKPKNKQLVIEGSLGKISFSNVKTPKPLLNIKRPETGETRANTSKKLHDSHIGASDRKSILKNIESVYMLLLKLEDHERKMPPTPEETDTEAVQHHLEWRKASQNLNQKIWANLKVLDPIIPGSAVPHPFIAFMSYGKGKRAIPRIFKFLDHEQRITVVTMIMLHLDSLDVVRLGHIQPGQQLPAPIREEIELFSLTITPSLFIYVNEAPLQHIVGFLGLILERTNVLNVVFTKIGLDILTMLISRAEIVKQAGGISDADWKQWTDSYNHLFDTIEPVLGEIFPGSVSTGDDMYVWSFLAAVGAGASPEQQQRLVLAVKDRVMETVMQSKALPAEMANQRLHNVNLFMRAIGLDVGLLQMS